MVKKQKITTIEDLAKKMDAGFEGVDKKFEGVDKKFDKLAIMIQNGFEEMVTKKNLNDLKAEVITLRYEFNELKLKISKLEIIPIEFNLKMQNFEKRINRIETELKLR